MFLWNIVYVSYSVFIVLFCVSLSQLELPGTWFARECECRAPLWSPTSCFIAGRESTKDREQEIPVWHHAVTPDPRAVTLGHAALWASSHVAQDTPSIEWLYWAMESVIDPAEFSALWHKELRNSHPFLQPSKVSRICCPLTIFPEKAMAPHSSTLAWKIPWTEEPGRLQPMGSLGVGHDWATSLSFFIFMPWRRKWQPTPVFLPGESQGWGSLVGCHLWGRIELGMTEAT